MEGVKSSVRTTGSAHPNAARSVSPRDKARLERQAGPPRGRRGVARGLTREKILDAAKALVAGHGTAAFRLIDLAHALHVRPPAIYNHFSSREDVLASLSTTIGERFLQVGDPAEGLSPSERLTGLVRGLAAMMHDDPLVARLQLEDVATSHLVDKGEGRRIQALGRDRIARLLDDGVKAGEFRAVNLDVLRAILLAAIPAAICWGAYERAEETISLEQLQDELVSAVMRHVRADGPVNAGADR